MAAMPQEVGMTAMPREERMHEVRSRSGPPAVEHEPVGCEEGNDDAVDCMFDPLMEQVGDGNFRWVLMAFVALLCTLGLYLSVGRGKPGGSQALLQSKELQSVTELPVDQLHKLGNGYPDRLRRFNNDAFHKLAPVVPFEPWPTDVFLAGVMGSGITLLSQIAHGLRSGGSMDFDEIAEVVPWFHAAHVCGQELDERQAFKPRLFKTHQVYEKLPEGARFIVLVRNPSDVFAARYRRFCNSSWTDFADIPRGVISLEDFAAGIFAHKSGNEVWKFLKSWVDCCWGDRKVLFVSYEDLVQQPDQQIRRIAEFMTGKESIPHDLLRKVEAQSTRQFMLEHHSQFDDHFVLQHLSPFQKAVDFGHMPRISKVRPYEPRQDLPRPILKLFEGRWESFVSESTGFGSYGDLRAALQRESGAGPGSVAAGAAGRRKKGGSASEGWSFLQGALLIILVIVAVASIDRALKGQLSIRFRRLLRSALSSHGRDL